ncbi:MAG: glycosyltransferase family 2 protein [Planctomycetaceae bacterium]|nr:glycosyltransferase family 2 protein [Planctomycetaceae bacterium]
MSTTHASTPLITVCIPHWQVRDMMAICLRSIRRHSQKYPLEVIVVDNGSRDASLDWLRSLTWIRLIERPGESVANWPANVFTAWDEALRVARGEFFVTMHSDVFVKRDDWLDPLLREMAAEGRVAAAGAWKLALESPFYAWQKRVLGSAVAGVKRLAGRRARSSWREGHYPRDYCAMYRRAVLLNHDLTFCPAPDEITGGYTIARQLWDKGFATRMIPVWEMARNIVHVAHGTAAVSSAKPLQHRAAQLKAERRARALFAQEWIQQLRDETSLDTI